jgi:UTP:GlnB (protein PII) uridylyltransferase
MWRLILVLVLLLTGCSSGEPSKEIVENAIALQTRQIQQQLQQNVSKLDISQVNITQKQPLSIDKLTGYRIQGTYDFTIERKLERGNRSASKFSKKVSKQKNPFDLYLQRQKEGKAWRLALPKVAKNGVFTWLTYAIN